MSDPETIGVESITYGASWCKQDPIDVGVDTVIALELGKRCDKIRSVGLDRLSTRSNSCSDDRSTRTRSNPVQLLNQLRDDAARLAEHAVPEVSNAVEQLLSGDSLAKVVVALVGRLEQDVPGLVHPETDELPASLTTVEEQPAASPVVEQTQAASPPAESDAERIQRLEAEVSALQSAQTPNPAPAPAVTGGDVA